MTAPEFSRPVRLDTIGQYTGGQGKTMTVEADETERKALARRFGLVEIGALTADVTLTEGDSGVTATGRLRADVVQSCVASGEPVPATVDEPFTILFRPEPAGPEPEEEIELDEGEMDVMFHDGAMIDVGEAVAQTLALALDPYPRAPDAEEKLSAALGEQAPTGPFAALAALKGKSTK